MNANKTKRSEQFVRFKEIFCFENCMIVKSCIIKKKEAKLINNEPKTKETIYRR